MKRLRFVHWIMGLALLIVAACPAVAAPPQPPQTGSLSIDAPPVDGRILAEIHRRMQMPAVLGTFPNKGIDGNHPESLEVSTRLVVWVSPNYQPDESWGLLVLPSNLDDSTISASYQKIGEKHRLLMVAPQDGGNHHYREWRVAHALVARQEMFKRYKINPARVYLTGPSGGGRTSSVVAILFPDLFGGALCNCGVDTVVIGGAIPKDADPIPALPDLIRIARDHSRFYLYTGSKDINHDDTLNASNWMKQNAFKYVTFFSQDGAGHAEMSDANFEIGLTALDAPLEPNAAIYLKQSVGFIKQGMTGEAMAALAHAIGTAPSSDPGMQAQTKLDPLIEAYQKDLEQVKATLAAGDHIAENAAIAKFARTYLPYAKNDIIALRSVATVPSPRRSNQLPRPLAGAAAPPVTPSPAQAEPVTSAPVATAAVAPILPPPVALVPSSTLTTKSPIPSAAALYEALKSVDEVYHSDAVAAVTPAQKTTLAFRILLSAQEEKGSVPRFALLLRARDAAAGAADIDALFNIIDQMGSFYQVDDLKMKADAIRSMGMAAHESEELQKVAAAESSIAEKALQADRYDIARQMADVALGTARFVRDDPALQDDAAARVRKVRESEAGYTANRAAVAALAANSNDPDANLKVGKFRCFIKGDWDGGLPLLVRGNDATLQSLATKDLAANQLTGNASADEQVALGDGWWAVGEKESGSAKIQIQSRACLWYNAAVPTLTGLTKARIKTRLSSIAVPAPQGTINLFKLFDIAKNAVNGNWEIRDGALVSSATPFARFEFPYQPPAEYDYRIVFTRTAGNADVVLLCWARGHAFLFHIGGWNNTECFFEISGTTGLADNPTACHANAWLENGRNYTAIVKVRATGVQVMLDGKLILDRKTDYSDMNSSWPLHRPDLIGVGSHASSVVFHSAEVIEITGKGKRLKDEEH